MMSVSGVRTPMVQPKPVMDEYVPEEPQETKIIFYGTRLSTAPEEPKLLLRPRAARTPVTRYACNRQIYIL